LPDDRVRAVGQENFHSDGRAIAAQGVADSVEEVLECYLGVFLAGQQQQWNPFLRKRGGV
jgi:hypothetical protein